MQYISNTFARRRNRWFASSALTAALALAGAPAGAAEAEDQSVGLAEIVVTARKQDESIQKVPIAITAFGEEQIEERRIFEVQDLGQLTPGLISAGDKQRGFPVIRGITTRSPNAGAEGAVGQYVDEVYQPRFSNQFTALLDLERIEVLKGPQGTLFGRNTVAGAINYVTRKPDDTPTGSFTVGAGNRRLLEARGAASGPLIEGRLAGGVSFMALRNRGFMTAADRNGERIGDDGRSDYGMRAALRWTPSEIFEANVSATHVRTRSAQIELAEGNPAGPTAAPIARLRLYTPSAFVADWRDYEVGLTDEGEVDRKSDQLTLRMDWRLGDFKLTSLSAYQRFDESQVVDSDLEIQPIAVTYSYEDSDTWSQELRLTRDGEVFRWHVGANYFFDDHTRTDRADVTSLPAPFNVNIFTLTAVETTSYAVFAQAYLEPIDGLTLTGGVRYSYDRRNYRKVSDPGNAAFGAAYDSDLTPAWDTNPHWDAITWTGSASYEITPAAMVYGSVSRGYRSGGVQGRAQTLATAMANYGPEHVTQYEVGAKTQMLDRRLQVNLAAYYMPYDDLQVSQAQITTFFGGAAIQNAASARVKGGEIEAKFQPTAAWLFELGYAYNDAKFRDYEASDNIPASIAAVRGCPAVYGCIVGDYVFDGAPFEFAPKHTINAAVSYEYGLADGSSVAVRADYAYRSKYLLNTLPQSFLARPDSFLETRFLQQPAYGLLNGSVTWTSDGGRYALSLWGRNLTGETYLIVGSDPRTVGNGALNKFVYGNGRTYGASLRVAY